MKVQVFFLLLLTSGSSWHRSAQTLAGHPESRVGMSL
jgi:hypothetical protein